MACNGCGQEVKASYRFKYELPSSNCRVETQCSACEGCVDKSLQNLEAELGIVVEKERVKE